MTIELTRTDVASVARAAEIHARRLVWRFRLPSGEREDLRQDLLTDFLRRLPSYDATRGTLEAFAQVVFRHRAARIASRIGVERRNRGALLSLDLPLDDDPRLLRERITEDEGLWSSAEYSEANVDRRHDVAQVLGLLAERDRELCDGLKIDTAAALARAGLGSRSQLYRRVADLRCVLTVHGLGPAWDDRAAA